MPELTIKEFRPPELHLPEIKREDIVRTLSDIEMPDAIKNIEMPDAIKRIEWPRIGRQSRRPRWPVAIGLVVVGVAGWLVLTNVSLRSRINAAIASIRDQVSKGPDSMDDIDRDDAVAFDAAETAPIESAPYDEMSMSTDHPDYPAGLGTDRKNGSPAEIAGQTQRSDR